MLWIYFTISLVFFILTALLFSFHIKIQKVIRYAKRLEEGSAQETLLENLGGPWGRILASMVRTKEKLTSQVQTANDEKNRMVAILESMAEGVVVINFQQKVLLMNSVLSESFGLARKGVEGKYFWEVFRDSEINEMIEQSLKQRLLIRREHTLLFSNRIYQIQTSPVFSVGEFLGVIAVFHDVTRLKELEKARSEFVANVSHELKTPLTSIIGFVETLREGGIEDSANRDRFLQIIDEHARKLSILIEDLLLLSKVELGKEELKKEAVPLDPLIEKLVSFLDKPIKSKGIQIVYDIQPARFWISADPKSIERVFLNLIDNAVKYNVNGGKIYITAREEGKRVRIRIMDTGIGIPPEDLPRIFERFYRVDKSRSRESGGSGLGLSIAKHIVERHGGQIQARSDNRTGTAFTITLPKDG